MTALRSCVLGACGSIVMASQCLGQEPGPNEAWSSPDQAARRGLTAAGTASWHYQLDHSGRAVEYGGWVYETRTGGYAYTTPRTSGDLDTIHRPDQGVLAEPANGGDDFVPTLARSGERVVGFYHIHPQSREYNEEQFSREDLEFAERYHVPIYLKTPMNRFRKYDPNGYDPDTLNPARDDMHVEPVKDEEPRPARIEGDPHLTMLDGQLFDFQGAGEFWAVRGETDDFRIMVRFEPYRGSETVSVTTGVAVAAGDDRVGVYATPPYVLINGTAPAQSAELQTGLRLADGVTVSQNGDETTLQTAAGDRIFVHNRLHEYLDTDFSLSTMRADRVTGLLGNFNGDTEDDFRTRDGKRVNVLTARGDAYRHELYDVWGASWRITEAESIFDYGDGKTPADYQRPDFPKSIVTYADLDPDARSAAVSKCTDADQARPPSFDSCVFDVATSGESRFADSYRDETAQAYADAVANVQGLEVAGEISPTGSAPSYPIEVRTAGQQLFFMQEQYVPALDLVMFGLYDAAGAPVGSKCFGCGPLGLLTVDTAGTYYLRPGTQTQGTPRSGKFAIRYWYVPPPDTFDLALGAAVAADRPGPGAGTIERPGAADEYRLTVDADGTMVHVHVNEYDPPLDLIPWEIMDSAGKRVAMKCLGCGADEDVALPSAGAFVLRVGTLDRDAGVGRYSLAVSLVKARD